MDVAIKDTLARWTARSWVNGFGPPHVVLYLWEQRGKSSAGSVLLAEEAEVDALIAALKEARKAAWPTPLKALCPASKELLSYLRKYGAVTPLKAREELGIEHLPRRIKDLKEHGYPVRSERKRGHAGKVYAKYTLEAAS